MHSRGTVESPEAARPAAVALDFTDAEAASSRARIPRRIRRRLLEGKSNGPSSVEEIEAKLRDADLRRQQFHEWLSSKARPKPRSPSWSSGEVDPGQRLEAKLSAAERKRLSLLTKSQMRLARLDELRQAAISGVRMRFEREREELGTRVESRVQQAEANRMRLIKAHLQRRAAIQERTTRSLLQRIIRENKHKERVLSAIFQKRAAAEKKRMGLLEAEKKRAHARVVQARRIAKTVYHRRETERRRMKEQLESRLQKAKRQRAEYLKQRGSPRSTAWLNLIRHGDFLSRKLARCWRRFVRLRRTTFALAKAYQVLELNEESIKSMPFEQVALLIESTTSLKTTKALLERLESRFSLLLSSRPSGVENIDHLLKHLASPNRKVPTNRSPGERGGTKRRAVRESRSVETTMSRFVVWKVKDARSLEEDLVRAACQLELSMLQTCKMTAEGQTLDLSHDMRAIQKQVIEDQKLLREKVQHLSGNAGIERMESALSDTRSKFFEAKENGSPLATPLAHISSTSASMSLGKQLVSVSHEHNVEIKGRSNRVVRSLFGISSSTLPHVGTEGQNVDVQSSCTVGTQSPTENELLVNEIMHWGHGSFSNNPDTIKSDEIGIKIKETMEKAFWDGILDSLKTGRPDYGRILGLVKEVRDELCDLAPQSWKQDILNSIDLDILSQVLESGSQDIDYFGNILENVLAMLQKLSSPANEDDMRKAHQKMLNSLTDIARSNDKQSNSFVVASIKGLRFVLEQIQTLKKEVSVARIKLTEPLIKGSAGLEYMQKAFTDSYGSPLEAATSLPATLRWLSPLRNSLEEEWSEHIDLCSIFSANHGLPVTAVRTGGGLSASSKQHDGLFNASGVDELPECNGEMVDKLVRLGLLKLASAIEGLTSETVPETLKLNVLRLRTVQSQFQQIIVIATSILVLRQVLLSEKSVASSELEAVILNTVKGLSELLKSSPDVGVKDITEVMARSSTSFSNTSWETKLQSRKEMMAGMLTKSLQNDNVVFAKVSRSIYLAARGVVLGGSGPRGMKLADAALKRVGATMLSDQVVNVGNVLIMMAIVTGRVHDPWYRVLV
ncbi:T-complex protein 11 [Musa troglodytarum]|uniref:T-complex protein 11 n=1 Tax=Musa troglodytarum TaxID=320322 RepID=A0A9E7H564_9LILI|nr:T-complex protein 11 [Musa troglodytarum]